MSRRLKSLIPPALLPAVRRLSPRRIRFGGRPSNWEQAQQQSSGYDAEAIIARVRSATREVVAGRAAYERDSVLFHTVAHSYPVVAALMRAAALQAGQLSVVDFGGSLGSTYWQYRDLFRGLRSLRWQVVEQPAFVAAGQSEFANETLSFAGSLQEVVPSATPPLLLAASVLQYLQDPMHWLAEFLRFAPQALLLDRLPVSTAPAHRLCIQTVPAYIYAASYPCWILSDSQLKSAFGDWTLRFEYGCDDGAYLTEDGQAFSYRGYMLERGART